MKSIFKKFKKLKTIYKVLYIIFGILFLTSLIMITHSLLLLKNIETLIRVTFITLCIISFPIYLFINILLLFSKRNKSYIANSIIICIINILFIIISVYIYKTYNIVDNMTKDKILYSSSLIVMKDTEFENNKDFTVGMINNEEDIEGNVLANKLIEKKKLDKIDIKYYSNDLEMISDLYNNKIKGMLTSSNYIFNYERYDNYSNIKNDTKVIYTYKENMKNKDIELSTNKSLTEPFTLLILGVDSETDGLKENAAFNGDTMMLVTFNPSTLNTTIFSIPRDTYVPIACNGNASNKINSSAVGGASCVIKTIKNLTGIDIDYYVKINFKGVVNLVDALKGIEVDVPVDFCEQDSNRLFGANEICLNKGLQTLSGEQALALARHRKTLLTGDFQRVQHQQLVVEAISKKAKTVRSVDKFYEILNTISNNTETNISTDEMLNLYNVAKKMLLKNNASINIEKTYLTGYDLTMYIPGLGNVYTFQYYEQSLNEIVDAMKINLGLKEPELTKTFNFSVNYKYEVPVIGKEYYTVKRNEALPNFVGTSISYLESWASSRNITVYKNYITEGMEGYDSNKNNIITYQNVIKGTLTSNISSISVNVIKVEDKTTSNIQNEPINNNDNSDTPTIEEPKQPENNNPTENQPEKENSENIDNQEEEKNPENGNQEE